MYTTVQVDHHCINFIQKIVQSDSNHRAHLTWTYNINIQVISVTLHQRSKVVSLVNFDK
jgi:hypothetical protein